MHVVSTSFIEIKVARKMNGKTNSLNLIRRFVYVMVITVILAIIVSPARGMTVMHSNRDVNLCNMVG